MTASVCKAAGVPNDIEFKSKSELALDIIRHARSTGIRYSWIGVDGGYGKEPLFLKTLDDEGKMGERSTEKRLATNNHS
jgi:SRSO17 transposase